MATGPRSQCSACSRMQAWDAEHATSWCAAFPAGIPDRVYYNSVDHRQPVEGDHGIQFEAKPGDEFPEQSFA